MASSYGTVEIAIRTATYHWTLIVITFLVCIAAAFSAGWFYGRTVRETPGYTTMFRTVERCQVGEEP